MDTFNQYELEYYVQSNGECPFIRWLDALDPQMQQRVLIRLTRLRQGNFGDCKTLGKNVSELRIHTGSGYRVYYTVRQKKIVIVFCGGDKATQKKDIQIAQRYAEDLKEK